MLKRGTLFILGAAVSSEIGFPLGNALKQRIIELIPSDRSAGSDFIRTVNLNFGDGGWPACKALQTALGYAPSIDNLIEHRSDDETLRDVAKVAIAAVIAAGERASVQSIKNSITPSTRASGR